MARIVPDEDGWSGKPGYKTRKVKCFGCGKEVTQSEYSALCDMITNHEHVCSYECNVRSGQIKTNRNDVKSLVERALSIAVFENGYTELMREEAALVAINLSTYDSELEDEVVDNLIPFVREYQNWYNRHRNISQPTQEKTK